MRCLLATGLLLLAAEPIYAQENDAEKIYRALEKKIQAAKSLKVIWEVEAGTDTNKGKGFKLRGVSQLAAGNRARIEFEGTMEGKDSKFLMVSDGQQMASQMSGAFPPSADKSATPGNFNKSLATMFARGGLMLPIFAASAKADEFENIDKMLPLSDFRKGADERVGNVVAQVIDYVITFDGRTKVNAKLWIDPKTSLPIKRRLWAPEDKKGEVITEVCIEFTLDPRLDAKIFELPK